MTLKPQDLYVVLKIVSANGERAPYAKLASDLFMSTSEVHASVQRAQECHLLHGPNMKNQPNLLALEEFLIHGLRYVFPPCRGSLTRGVSTSYAAEPLKSMLSAADEPSPVWPCDEGNQRGMAFEPRYRGAPLAALRDPKLHAYLAIADALRDTGARQKKLAEGELHTLFQDAKSQRKS